MAEKTTKKTPTKSKDVKSKTKSKDVKSKTKSKDVKSKTKSKDVKSKTKSKKIKEDDSSDDMGIVIVDDDIEIDQEKVNEERRAYLEEARSQEAFD